MTLCTIYALTDPRLPASFENVRYVGKTERGMATRLKWHMLSTSGEHKTCWIKSLKKEGLKPSIWPLSVCSLDTWKSVESQWIKRLRQIANLTNLTDGGDGVSGFRWSEADKKIMSVRATEHAAKNPVSQATRMKISKALTGTKKPPFTEGQLMKMRMSKLGKKRNPQAVIKGSNKIRGIPRPQYVRDKLRDVMLRIGHKPAISPDIIARRSNSNRGQKRSQEIKDRMSIAHHPKKVVCLETGQVFETAKIAASHLGSDRRKLYRALKLGSRHKQFHWRYACG